MKRKKILMNCSLFLLFFVCVAFSGCRNVNVTSNGNTTSVSVIGGSDGPTSTFIAGKTQDCTEASETEEDETETGKDDYTGDVDE